MMWCYHIPIASPFVTFPPSLSPSLYITLAQYFDKLVISCKENSAPICKSSSHELVEKCIPGMGIK